MLARLKYFRHLGGENHQYSQFPFKALSLTNAAALLKLVDVTR